MDYIKSNANGSTFLEISKSVFRALEIIKPPFDIRKKFDAQIDPVLNKARANSVQIRNLEKLRDALLPKLMSGEVKIESGK